MQTTVALSHPRVMARRSRNRQPHRAGRWAGIAVCWVLAACTLPPSIAQAGGLPPVPRICLTNCPSPASITSISPTVDEPTGAGSSGLVTVSGSGLDGVTTLEIGPVSYKEYPCPVQISPAPPKVALARVTAVNCDPPSPLDLHGQEFAVYDNGDTIMAPDPDSAVDYEPNASSALPEPGSTVGVTGVDDGQTVPSSASYSFPLGEMGLQGPLDWEGVADGTTNYPPFGGMEWTENDGNHAISVNPPDLPNAVTYATTAAALHLFVTFADSGETEHAPPASDPNGAIASTQKGWTVGNGGTYAAEVFWCQPIVGSTTGSTCNDYQGNPGKWTPVGSVHTVTLRRVAGQTVGTDLQLPLGAAFSPTQLVGTFEIVMSEFETDSNDCRGPACGAGPKALPSPSNNESCFNQSNNIASPSSINDEYTGVNAGPLQRLQCATSPKFNVVVEPLAWLQLSAIPYTILYFPPGDQSKSALTLTDNFGTSVTLNGSNKQSNSTAVMNSGSTKYSIEVSYGGFGLNAASTAGWSTTDEAGYTLNNGTSNQASAGLSLSISRTVGPDEDLVPGSGDQCASSTNCLPADYIKPAEQYLYEPFWNDVYLLEVHPQFAYYRFGSGQDEYVQRGADPDFAAITVAQLEGCARGADPANVYSWCSIPVATSFVDTSGSSGGQSVQGVCPAPPNEPEACLTLTPADAANLLSLDPFYAGGQNADLSKFGNKIVGSEPYGGDFSPDCGSFPSNCSKVTSPTPVTDNAQVYTTTLNNSQKALTTTSGSETDETTITNVVSNGESEGASIKLNESPVSAGESLTFSGGDQTTTKDSISTTFGNSNAVSDQQVSTDMATLDDVDNTSPSGSCSKCHNPLPNPTYATIYLDRHFGTFMFQDAGAPGPPPRSITLAQVGRILLGTIGQEQQNDGVASSSPQRAPVDQVLGLRLMSAPGDKFGSGEALTQSQLASAFAALFHVSAAEAASLFTSTQAGAGAGVTEAQLSAALAEAFGLGSTASQELVNVGTTTFNPSVVVTRGEAAETLAAAVEDDCSAGCPLPKPKLARAPIPVAKL
jgi:hypothetical protein